MKKFYFIGVFCLQHDIGKMILQRLIELYITVRGFGFASSCLEMYKQHHHKKTQKSKSLRKTLLTNDKEYDCQYYKLVTLLNSLNI